MAGPGGGAPRRSHTKSRKGCKTCKKRHIRCDENFPQCRNCSKHSCRCDYMDAPPATETPPKTPQGGDLLSTTDVDGEIDQWRSSGVFPLSEMHFYPQRPISDFPPNELRFVHHLASISRQMLLRDTNRFTIWTNQVPTFLRIASTYDFVLHAVLALSATHIAWVSGCDQTQNAAYQHRGIALKGLQAAIGNFSRANADAVLAATLLLSLQATEWRGWCSLVQGTSSVIEAMRPWRHASEFAAFMDEKYAFSHAMASSRALDSQQGQGVSRDGLQRVFLSLQRVEAYLVCNAEETRALLDLTSFVQRLLSTLPSRTTADQFDLLQPLRAWLLWLPVTFFEQGEKKASGLVILAQVYAAGLAIEQLLPSIGAACFGSMSVGPMEDIGRTLNEMRMSQPHEDAPDLLNLLDLPINTISKFRSCMNDIQQTTASYSPMPLDHDFYGPRSLRLDPTADMTAGPSNYGPAYGQSQSGDVHNPTGPPALSDGGPSGMPRSTTFLGSSLRGQLEEYNVQAFGGMAPMQASPTYVNGVPDNRHGMGSISFTDSPSSSCLWSA